MDGSWLTSASGREGWRGKQDKGRGPPRRRLLAAALVCALRDAIRRRRRVFNITSAHTAGWRACTTHVSCYCSFTLIFTHSSVLCARLSCGVTPVSCSEFSGSVSSIESFKIKCYPVIKLVLGVGSGDGQNVKAKNFERRAALELCSWPACPSKTHNKRLDWPRQQRPSAGSCEIMFILAWSRVWGTAFQERVASRSTVLYFTAAMTRRRTAPDLALCDENELWGVLRRGGRAACGSTSRGRWDYEPKQQVPTTR